MRSDVVVLGSGVGGSVLATILARHGLSVALVDRAPHPRFAIGESTIPYTTQAFAILSELFDVPELFPREIRRAVGARCGVKRHFGYVHHTEGEPADPSHVSMAWLGEPEFHFFRQDVDAHLFHLALRRGVVPVQGAEVVDVDCGDDGVRVHLADGRSLSAGFVVDGTGARSVLARQWDLRRGDSGLRTPTRSLFTHMLDVRPFDQILPPHRHRMPGPLSEGTLHHVFDGGWIWVIPFDNHPESTNPLCSVGLQLDARRFPVPDNLSPQEEFEQWCGRFPMVAAQFDGARAVRPWVRTGRLQFTSHAASGPRWALLPHAWGFVDPLYSRGLSCTLDGVKTIATALLGADRRWDEVDLTSLQGQYERLVGAHDDLAYGSLVSWRHPDLWRAWWYVWVLSTATEFFAFQARHRFHTFGDRDALRQIDHYPADQIPGYGAFMSGAVGLMSQVDDGSLSPADGFAQLRALIEAQPFHYPRVFEHLCRTGVCRPPSMVRDAVAMARFATWVGRHASPEIRDMVMPMVKGRVFRYAWGSV